jgi:CheY-like chemotaxis protein
MTLKIFVADDSVTIQKIVSLAFNDEDAIVESVSNGDVALDSLRAFNPDVALVDVFMPGCSGYEICARMKEDPDLSRIPVILLVGTFEPFDELEAARVKSDGYLTKPFDTAELLQTIHSLVEKYAAKHDNNAVVSAQIDAAAAQERSYPAMRSPINAQVWNSFLSSNRILDLFDIKTLKAAAALRPQGVPPATIESAPAEIPPIVSIEKLPDEVLNAIVDKVLRRMSADVIREVAWEVVPELSESIIRSTIDEQNRP